MKLKYFFISAFLLFGCFSCSKKYSVNKFVDNIFILQSTSGYIDTFYLHNNWAFVFEYSDYKNRFGEFERHFSLFSGPISDYNFDLRLIRPDSIISIGKVYGLMPLTNETISFFQSKVGYSVQASRVELVFSKYQKSGRKEGSFTAFLNGQKWYWGRFCFDN